MAKQVWIAGIWLMIAVAGCGENTTIQSSPLPPTQAPLSFSTPAGADISQPGAKYTHPEWGITVTYPNDWKLSVPDFNKLAEPPAEGVGAGYTYNPNIEQMRMLGHSIELYVPGGNGSPASALSITLNSYTISPGTKLQTWVDIYNQLGAIENPLASTTKITSVAATGLPFANIGDQVVYDILDNGLSQIETIWIAKGELIFSISTSTADPMVINQLHDVAATLEFNDDQLAAIRAKAPFSGNEQQIKATIDHLLPH